MPRPAWTLFAYRLIVPDEQFDLFACRENRLDLDRPMLKDRRLCSACRDALGAQRKGLPSAVSAW